MNSVILLSLGKTAKLQTESFFTSSKDVLLIFTWKPEFWFFCFAISEDKSYIKGLDKIMETLENFKQTYSNIVFWLQPSCEIWLCAASHLTVFKETGFSQWLLSSALIFRAVFLQSFLTIRCPVGWGCRIRRLHLCRGVRPPANECPGYMTQNNLMARLQWR